MRSSEGPSSASFPPTGGTFPAVCRGPFQRTDGGLGPAQLPSRKPTQHFPRAALGLHSVSPQHFGLCYQFLEGRVPSTRFSDLIVFVSICCLEFLIPTPKRGVSLPSRALTAEMYFSSAANALDGVNAM